MGALQKSAALRMGAHKINLGDEGECNLSISPETFVLRTAKQLGQFGPERAVVTQEVAGCVTCSYGKLHKIN